MWLLLILKQKSKKNSLFHDLITTEYYFIMRLESLSICDVRYIAVKVIKLDLDLQVGN